MFLKLAFAGVISSVLSLGPALAGDDMPLGADLPSDPQQQTAQPVASSVLDEPIKQIAKSSDGCAVLDKDFPGLRQHAMYPFFKSMSLNQIAALSKGRITFEMLMQAKTDLTTMGAELPTGAASAASVATPAVAPVSVTALAAAQP